MNDMMKFTDYVVWGPEIEYVTISRTDALSYYRELPDTRGVHIHRISSYDPFPLDSNNIIEEVCLNEAFCRYYGRE